MLHFIALSATAVKWGIVFSATFRYTTDMAETLRDLWQPILDRRGWTIESLSDASGISVSGLRKLAGGSVRAARGPTVHKLAKALGVPPKRVRAAIEASRIVG